MQNAVTKTIMEDLNKRMDGSISSLNHALSGLRTGRASAALLDGIKVEAYGDMMPLNQIATINVPEPRMILVQVWDGSLAKSVEKAIVAMEIGLNPIAEGAVIRVPLPDLSEERRKELCKKAAEYGENAKISVRNIRRDGIDQFKKLEKSGDISEDDLHNLSEQVQKMTDTHTAKIDGLVAAKNKDIMVV